MSDENTELLDEDSGMEEEQDDSDADIMQDDSNAEGDSNSDILRRKRSSLRQRCTLFLAYFQKRTLPISIYNTTIPILIYSLNSRHDTMISPVSTILLLQEEPWNSQFFVFQTLESV